MNNAEIDKPKVNRESDPSIKKTEEKKPVVDPTFPIQRETDYPSTGHGDGPPNYSGGPGDYESSYG